MGHYYRQTETGIEPAHFVKMSSREGTRPTRISDVRKMWKAGEIVVPSVTTILNILDKPALKNWLIDQHLQQAHKIAWRAVGQVYSDDGPDMLIEPAFIKEVKRLAEAEMSKAPDAGTDLHKVLEDYISGKGIAEGFEKHCANVQEVLDKHTRMPEGAWECEKYVLDMAYGFGGCVDLVSGNDDTADGWVIDYKTKQTADKFKPGKMAYPEHARQLAAYREGLGMSFARCANIFICIETGEVDFHEHSEEDLQTGWKVFEHSLAIWKLNNGVNE